MNYMRKLSLESLKNVENSKNCKKIEKNAKKVLTLVTGHVILLVHEGKGPQNKALRGNDL